MAIETTFWGFIHMDAKQVEKVKEYLSLETYDNKIIDENSIFSETSRAITLSFGKIVRGGYDEKDFWINEIESFLKNIEAFSCTVCFEFDGKEGLFVYKYLFSYEPSGWTIYENHFDLNWDDTNSRFLSNVK